MIWFSIFSKIFAELINPPPYDPVKVYFNVPNIRRMNLKSQAILYESPRNSLHISRCFCPPLAGVGGGHPELVEGLPAGTVENRSLQPHYMLAEKVDIVGTVA
jgi:hypothetical protein